MKAPWRTPGIAELRDTTHGWVAPDTKQNWLDMGKPSIYGEDSFDYVYNEHGFRCDSMADPLRHTRRMLVAGCSFTEGIGLPVDATWGYRLTARVRAMLDDADIPYWSAAIGGRSQDWVARQLTILIPMLKPMVVVVYLPEPCRRELWWQDRLDHWYPQHPHDEFTRRAIELWSDDQQIYDSHKNLLLMHNTCVAHGAMLRWAMWSNAGPELRRSITDGLPDDVQRCAYSSALHVMDHARDGAHAGPLSHERFTDYMWSEIGSDVMAKMR